MAVIFDGELQDENGNIFRPHSNSKTSVYTNEKTEAATTSDALDELFAGLEDAAGVVNLTLDEYNALSEEEKNNGKVYFVPDSETDVNDPSYASEATAGLMTPIQVKALKSVTPKVNLTIVTADKELFNSDIRCTFGGGETIDGTFDSKGKCVLPLPYVGTYLIKTCDGTVTSFNAETEGAYTLELNSSPTIYAFHIDDSESDPENAVTYLEGAKGMIPAHMNYNSGTFNYGSWENAFFMPRPCMLKYDGTVDYYLDENDYTKKEDGSASDIENPSYEGNAMMEWGKDGKKIWVKVDTTSDGCSNTSPTIYISDTQVDDTYKAYSFINNQGNLVEHFYTPIYNGSNIDSKLRSLSGQTCSVSTSFDTDITLATANNIGNDVLWYTETFADRCLINYLLILIGRSLDTQTVFGDGFTAVDNTTQISTGTMNDKGLFWGENTGKYGVKVFGMENWWGNVFRRISGLISVENGTTGTVYSKMTYGTQDGSTANGYNMVPENYIKSDVLINKDRSGYSTKAVFSNNGMIQSEWNVGSATTYYCDFAAINASGTKIDVGYMGGYWSRGKHVGAFYLNLTNDAASSHPNTGTSLSCKPLV